MPIDPALEPVRQARLDLQASRDALVAAIFRLGVGQDGLAGRRAFGQRHGDTTARQNLTAATQAHTAARATERQRREALSQQVSLWLGNRDPEADLQRLSTDSPILLFPVRIETRFDLPGNSLLVRIFPDEIFVNLHERALTPEEYEAGVAYHTGRSLDDQVAERERWRRLVGRFPVRRAAYIARVMAPISTGTDGEPVFPDLPRRPDVWTRPPRPYYPTAGWSRCTARTASPARCGVVRCASP